MTVLPPIIQKALIERAAHLQMRVATLDRRFADSGEMTERETAVHLA